MARSYKRDKNGRFAGIGGASYGNLSDLKSDERYFKRERKKLESKQKELKQKKDELKQKLKEKPGSNAQIKELEAKRDDAARRAKEAGEKAAASRARIADLKKQLEASKARLGGKSATKRGARK